MQLKCTRDNHGYYKVGECYNVVDIVGRYLVIEVNKGWTGFEKKKFEILCTEEDFKNKFIKISDADFMIIDE